METNKIITIAVIAVVIAAGFGVVWLVLSGNDRERIYINAELEVYGNANNDARIDQADIDLINDIIAGRASFSDYPLADANYDGIVDEKDVEQVNKIMNASASNRVRVYHINYFDGGKVVVDTMYPITSAISTGAANSLLIYKYLGISSEIKGLFWSSQPDSALFHDYVHLFTEDLRVGRSSTGLDIDKASILFDKENVTAVIAAENRNNLPEEPILEGAGIDVVRAYPAAVDPKSYMSTILLIAFLFDTGGKGYMDKCSELIKWYEDFLTDLNDKLSSVKNKVTAISSSMTNYVSTGNSDYTDVLTAAGAVFPLTDVDNVTSALTYNGSTDTWLNKYDIEYVINIRVSSTDFSWYGGTALTSGTNTLKTYMNNWRTLECYEKNNVYVICGDMPVMLRIAYAAQTMYGDVFGPDYAYNLNVDFVKKFFGWDESMIKGKVFAVSMEDLGIAK